MTKEPQQGDRVLYTHRADVAPQEYIIQRVGYSDSLEDIAITFNAGGTPTEELVEVVVWDGDRNAWLSYFAQTYYETHSSE